jgi:3alpha(or 20beta)-hydroxysteroid dehydrogenase
MSNRFLGKHVLVTGAIGGLGEAMVRAFAREGASVVIASRHRDKGDQLAREVGNRSMSVELDVTSEAAWKEVVQTVERSLGTVSVLVNNAAYLATGGVETISLKEWHDVLDTNLTGTLLGMRAVVPSMRRARGGSIVNVNSIAGLAGAPGIAAYGASKWAIRGLSRTAAMEFARDNIRVNGVHAGIINTPLAFDKQTGKELVPVESFAIPRQATPAEIAEYVLFVASEQAAFSTGCEFVADGGFLLGPLAESH